MAYNADNEVKQTLVDIEKNKRGDFIRVSKVTKKNNESDISYDIRNMYTTDEGEPGFTSKGIRVKNEMIPEIFNAILTDLDDDTFNKVVDIINKIANNEE